MFKFKKKIRTGKWFVYLLLMLFSTGHVWADTKGEKININAKNISLYKAFKQLENKYSYIIAYDQSKVDDALIVDVELSNADIEKVMDELLKSTNFSYKIYDKHIVIKSKPVSASSQPEEEKITIKGKITDEKGEPLPFCNVYVENTTIGAVSDMDGNYTLTHNKAPFNLVFSSIGYKKRTEVINQSSTLNVQLSVEGVDMDEVVVTGYQKIDRKLFTGSAAKLTAEDAKVSGVADVGRMLEGKAAGVTVQNVSGTFGAAPKIRVRGASSIHGDTKPLWVVDGVVLEDVIDVSPDQLSSGDVSTLISSSVAGINAEDIESFQILKDASATALYGARAMNGVVVITTKSGNKSGKVNVNVSSEFTVKMKPRYSDYDILNSQDQMSVFREMERKGWLNHAEMMRSKDAGVYWQMYDAINTYNPRTDSYALENTPAARADYLRRYEYANTDWFDLLFRNSLMQNHSLSLSGGNDNAQFYASTSFLTDEGWTIADNVDRVTYNLRGNFKLNEKLKVGIMSKGSIRDQRAPGTFSRQRNDVSGDYSREFDINPFSYALNTSRTVVPFEADGSYRYNRMNHNPFNIFKEFDNNWIDLNVLDLSIQADLEYKFNKHIDYKFIGSIRRVKSTTEHKITGDSNVSGAYRAAEDATIMADNKYLWHNPETPNDPPLVVLPYGGFYSRADNKLVNYYFRNVINMNYMFGENHSTAIMLGQETKSADRSASAFDGYGIQYDRGNTVFTDPNIISRSVQAGFPYFALHNYWDRYVAFFGNGAYTYKGKYILNGTYRLDGSNQLGSSKQARWLSTWNISGKWNIKEEDFMLDNKVISTLQLRATYGLTASMGPATNSKAVYSSGITVVPFPSEIQNGISVRSLENSDLTWEKQYELNIGVDLGLFNNRISLTTDAYQRKGFDLIAAIRTSGIGGEMYKLANYADMDSYGIEFSLNTRNTNKSEFQWTTNATFAYNKNEITRLASNPYILTLTSTQGAAIEGGPVRGLYSIPFAGLNDEGVPTFYDHEGNRTTQVNFQSDIVDHLIYEGPVDPKISGGLGNRFTWKNLSMNIFMSYQFGNVIRLYPSFNARYSDLDAMPKDMLNRWLSSGDENYTDIPRIASKREFDDQGTSLQATYNAYNYSDRRVAKGDFVRLKEVSLSYNLPNKWAEKLKATGISLKLQATNLCLLYADKKLNGQDPEFFGTGGVALPVPKQYTLNLRLNF
ncbi:MAG: SusC/RagA family TonB-linked outer membrane protein [Carboxylicivirga sp.]|jgi:TonB-linked SusC/RagA family outer membrane protein|nr:SusC/RagA family TonB-linked outer membrane protein [Carboxylicivirga sp.]